MNELDPGSRLAAADLVERLATGALANHEFDRLYPDNTRDQAVHQIYIAIAPFIDDDLHEHALVDSHKPTPDEHALLHRCHAFLRTTLPYEWPFGIVSVFRLFGIRRDTGDRSVWPFYRKEDMLAAVQVHSAPSRSP